MSGFFVTLAAVTVVSTAAAVLLVWLLDRTVHRDGWELGDADAPEVSPTFADAMRYADIILTVGIDPDDPDQVRVVVENCERRSLCDARAALALTQLAESMIDRHNAEGCGQ